MGLMGNNCDLEMRKWGNLMMGDGADVRWKWCECCGNWVWENCG